LFGFFAITASLFITVYEYPTFATSGFSLVFFLLLCGFLWFLPVSLCSAELATVDGYQEGGIFGWVSKTLGEKYGFAAIFFQWFQITVGFVTMIYFIIGALSYVISFPALDSNPMYKFIAVLIIFWGLTLLQLKGTKVTAIFAKLGFVLGITIPVLALFFLTIFHLKSGHHAAISITASSFIPKWTDMSSLVIFMLAYMGVEASAPHINEMKNPKRDYPLAMVMLVILAIALNTIGGLTISAVLPLKDLSLSSGVVQTFQALILHFGSGLGWAVKLIAIMIALGVMGEVSAWVVGPSRGMYTAAEQGLLPEKMKKVNKHGVPVPLIMVQGVVVTIWAAILTFGGGGNNLSFLTAISLTVVIYLVGYLLFFIGYLVLIFKKSSLKRTYQIPGGKIVKVIVALIGLVTSIFALCISFVPPASIAAKSDTTYMVILSISFIVTVLIPFIIYSVHDKKDISPKDITHLDSSDINKFTHPRARGEHIINPDEKHIMNQDKL
ncbi:glutamate:gamma-aminobutyrate antiporter, partial [Listeria welshimeri]|nr:glutamate:gamma-aminobutyrate antiporter [Listeria welshimeri]